MPYQYVREPLATEEADRLANTCETPTEQLIVWTLLDTGLRVSELCSLTTKDILWQQCQHRIRDLGDQRLYPVRLRGGLSSPSRGSDPVSGLLTAYRI
jgi:integrase